MARALLERPDPPSPLSEGWDRRVSRVAASALAMAVSVLAVGTVVVAQSDEALDGADTSATAVLSSGTVMLSDDDNGRSLFDLADMAPNRPIAQCIQVTYEGTITPVDLALRAEAVGDLARFLDVTVEQGDGGGFGSCAGFAPNRLIYEGTLQELAASGWLGLDRLVNLGQQSTYRVTFELQDVQEAQGRDVTTSFLWEVTPG